MRFLNNVLKWAVQIMCMLGDLMLLTAAVVVIITTFKSGSLFLSIVGVVIIAIAYKTWKGQGGLIAWRERKQFMYNWDKLTRVE